MFRGYCICDFNCVDYDDFVCVLFYWFIEFWKKRGDYCKFCIFSWLYSVERSDLKIGNYVFVGFYYDKKSIGFIEKFVRIWFLMEKRKKY